MEELIERYYEVNVVIINFTYSSSFSFANTYLKVNCTSSKKYHTLYTECIIKVVYRNSIQLRCKKYVDDSKFIFGLNEIIIKEEEDGIDLVRCLQFRSSSLDLGKIYSCYSWCRCIFDFLPPCRVEES